MKLHLPISLYRSLLAVILSLPVFCGSALAEVHLSPGLNGRSVVSDADDYKKGLFNDYSTNYWGFELRAPESSTDNTVYLVGDATKTTQIKSGQLYWVSDTDAPVSLDISGITNGVFWQGASVSNKTSVRAFVASYLDDVTISGNKNNGGFTVSSKITGVLSVFEENSRIAISANYGDVKLSENEISYYSSSTPNLYGAAISMQGSSSTLNLDNNQAVTITGNKACGNTDKKTAEGGAVYLYKSNTFSISGNEGLVTLAQNQVKQEKGYAHGGAVALGSSSVMNIAGNTAGVLIHSNTAESGIESVNTSNYTAGGAVYGNNSKSVLNITGTEGTASYNEDDAAVIIANNAAITTGYGARGGAACVTALNISDNQGDVLVQGNRVQSQLGSNHTYLLYAASAGGAFYVGGPYAADNQVALKMSGNGNVTISGNQAAAVEGIALGGAIFADDEKGVVDISGNTGMVKITGNYAQSNTTVALGGAVYAMGGIRIEGNEDVLLRGNYEQSGDTFRLRSLYYGGKYKPEYSNKENLGVLDGVTEFRLMAAAGKKIEIHDSVYSGRSGTGVQVVFNGSYTAADGTEVKGDGTILFTGANTVADLKAAKLNAGIAEESITISDDEINNSRTSEFKTNIQLLGGRLVITDQAQVKSAGLTVENGATVELRNGGILNLQGKLNAQTDALSMDNSHLVMNTSLEETQIGVINVLSASTLTLCDGAEVFCQNITGLSADRKLTVEGNGMLNLGNSIDISGYELGESWTGTVKRSGINQNVNLFQFASGSAIGLENCQGHTGGLNNEYITSDLVLTKSFSENNEEQAAFLVTDGSSKGNDKPDFVMNTFSGKVSGDGKMVIDQAGSGTYTGFEFTGDVSAWKGAFEMNAKNTFNLVFSGDADEIVNDIKNTSTEGTLILKLQSGNNMSLSGDIKTNDIRIANTSDDEQISKTSKVDFSGSVNTGSMTVSNDAELVFSGDSTTSEIRSFKGNGHTVNLTKNGSGSLHFSGGVSGISSVELNGGILELSGYKDSSKALNSNITVNSGAELRFSDTVADILNHGATGKNITVNGGTVDFGETRQSMGTWAITLKNGATLKGAGMHYKSAHTGNDSFYSAAIDVHDKTVITVESGANSIESNIRLRNDDKASLTFNVTDEKASVDVSGRIHYDDEGKCAGTINKQGKGSVFLSSPVQLANVNHEDGGLSLSSGSKVKNYRATANGGALQLSGDVQIEKLEIHAGILNLSPTDTVVKQIDELDGDMGNTAAGTLRLDEYTKLQVNTQIKLNTASSIELARGSELRHNGFELTNTTDETAVLRATADGVQYSNEKTEYRLENGYVKVLADTGAVLMRNQLVNTAVENAGGALLQVRNTGNSLVGVHATTASIELFEQKKHELKDLIVKDGHTVSAYTDVDGAAENLATLHVDGTADFGIGITLNANLVMEQGAVVTMADKVKLEGELKLQFGLTLKGDVLQEIANLKEGGSYVLFTNVDALKLQTPTLYNMRTLAEETEALVNYTPLMNDTEVAAGDYFINLDGNSNLVLSYNSTDGTVSITNSTQAIPEPTTAALSLLGLAALVARRRRK